MRLDELDPHDAPTAQRWYAAMRAGAGAGRVHPLVVTEGALLASLRANASNPSYDRRPYGAWDGDTCLGTLLVELPRRDNRHRAEVDVNVPPAYRRRGVGAALFDEAVRVARSAGRTVLADEVNVAGADLADAPGGRFALARGFASRHVERRLLLELPVDGARLARLEGEAARRAAGYRVVGWQGPVPGRYLAAVAWLRTLMERDVPAGEADRNAVAYDTDLVRRSEARLLDQGYGLVTALALDPGGDPVGYSTMFVPPGDGGDALQDDTFVLRAHRGHRLGTLAKVANLRRLAAGWPGARRVHAWTAEANSAMNAVNDAFGFRAVETMHEVEATLPAG